MNEDLYIKSRTTGFASPADSYVDKRLDLNDLIMTDVKSTYFFKYDGIDEYHIKKGNIVVIDRSQPIQLGDLILCTDSDDFKVKEYRGDENVWGKVTWILNKL